MAEPKRPTKKRTQVARIRTESPRMRMWMAGELDPADLTDEEVARCQLMDKDGHFKGRPTKMVPRELMMAFRSEAQKRLMQWFQEQVPLAQKATQELLQSRHLAPGDATRLRAAEGIFERVVGKVGTETHIVVDKGKSFEDFVGEALIDVEEDDA